MRSRTTLLLAALLANIGCEPDDEPDTGDSPDVEVGPMPLADVDDVVLVESLSRAPFGYFLVVIWLPMALDAESCPSLETLDGVDYVITGGCTDEVGDVWIGSVTYTQTETEIRETFDGWGIEGDFLTNGVITATEAEDAAIIVADGFSFGALYLAQSGAEREVSASYAAFTTTAPMVDGEMDLMAATAYAGDISVAEAGVVTVSGTVGPRVICGVEADSGGLNFVGDGQASVAYDGATDCDGCYVATTSDGATHEVCQE